MPVFRFRCLSILDRKPLEAEVFLEDRSRGFTPLDPTAWLVLETPTEGPQAWFAFLYHRRIAAGRAFGGDFELMVDEKSLTAELRPAEDAAFQEDVGTAVI